eukprot:5755382-Amphidinium_carterae.1
MSPTPGNCDLHTLHIHASARERQFTTTQCNHVLMFFSSRTLTVDTMKAKEGYQPLAHLQIWTQARKALLKKTGSANHHCQQDAY